MLSKNRLKFLRALDERKTRKAEKCYLAEGYKVVNELISFPELILEIFCTAEWLEQKKLSPQIPLTVVSEKELGQISSLSTPQSVIALVKIEERSFDIKSLKDQLILILDDIKDPGNMGTLIRIADWFGIRNIIASPHTVDVYNSKVVQSTMGSISRVNVFYKELSELLPEYISNHGILYGALLEGENIYEKNLKQSGAIVLGNESTGISDPVKRMITDPIKIPSYKGGAESLNVAVAGGIICAEFRRRI